jgi:hypothetical protein
LDDPPPILNYAPRTPTSRTWGISRPVWALVAAFCAFVEPAGWMATGGRINGGLDWLFILVFGVVGLVALINAVRPAR